MAKFENRLACVINANGSIARGYMIEKCELRDENEYITTGKIPLQGEARPTFLVRSEARWMSLLSLGSSLVKIAGQQGRYAG